MSTALDDEKRQLLKRNLELLDALTRVHEAVVNHKLNCKEVTSNDLTLWDTVFKIVDYSD